jgi:transcriptional regulator with XRE-family HTH domain
LTSVLVVTILLLMAQEEALRLLDAAMAEKGWGQTETEEICGQHKGSIAHYRAGRRPSAAAQEIFEQILGIPRTIWMTDEELRALEEAKARAAVGGVGDRRKRASRPQEEGGSDPVAEAS